MAKVGVAALFYMLLQKLPKRLPRKLAKKPPCRQVVAVKMVKIKENSKRQRVGFVQGDVQGCLRKPREKSNLDQRLPGRVCWLCRRTRRRRILTTTV